MPRFAILYFMKAEPDRVREAVPSHIAYWTSRRLPAYLGGPFADRSGGLISFEARDLAEATAIADGDPFAVLGLLETRWIKEWVVER